MIFDKEFDKVLCLILQGDKENRDKILEVIDSIPIDLYCQIKNALLKYHDYEDKNVDIHDRETFCLTGEYMTDKQVKYSFSIDMLLHSLNISRDKDFTITLYKEAIVNDAEKNEEQVLGGLKLGKDKIDYIMRNVIFAKRVITYSNGMFSRMKKIDVQNVSNIETLRDSKKHKLVRKK